MFIHRTKANEQSSQILHRTLFTSVGVGRPELSKHAEADTCQTDICQPAVAHCNFNSRVQILR